MQKALFFRILTVASAHAQTRDLSWIQQYSSCYHAVENIHGHLRQTSISLKSGTDPQLLRFQNSDHLWGDQGAQSGIFLFPGDTAFFIPLSDPLVVDQFEDNLAVAGQFAHDEYSIELTQKDKPSLYLTVTKDWHDSVSTVGLSLQKTKSKKYTKVKLDTGFDDHLRASFKTALIAQIKNVTDAQTQELKDLGLSAPVSANTKNVHPGLKSRSDPNSAATLPSIFADKLKQCAGAFARPDAEDQDLVKAVNAETDKFLAANPSFKNAKPAPDAPALPLRAINPN